jgi:transcriptional regulator GlxA family with amidase domain
MHVTDVRRDFFSQIVDPGGLFQLFEHLPGVYFLAKDLMGRFVAANAATRERLGAKDAESLIGTTDADWLANEVARNFRQDDAVVISSRKPLLDRLEAWNDERGQLQWFLTNKLPVLGRNDRCIGVMAIIRRYDEQRSHHTAKEAAQVVAYARAHLRHPLTAADLARSIGVSERHLHRKLRQAMGVTPHELVLRLRIEAAGEQLATSSAAIARIAVDYGFCDQSAFTKHFRTRTGLTPRAFRKRHQG